MANHTTHRDQSSTRNNSRTPNVAGSTSRTSQQRKAEGGVSTTRGDRERPIASGREGNRDRSTGVRQQRNAALISNNPISVMRRLAQDMDQLFEQFGLTRSGIGLTSEIGAFGSLLGDDLLSDRNTAALNTVWSPQVEVLRRGDKIVIRADIPGVKREDVRVHVENDMLTITGERKEEHEEDREGFYRSERSYGEFYRAIPLPEGVNSDQCDASFKDGVLEVTLPAPKSQERKAKRIQVR